jgi:DNA polymerase
LTLGSPNLAMIAIDFETYYDNDCTIKTLGADAYCRHPKFAPYMVALHGEGLDYTGPTKTAPWDRISSTQNFVAHNASFDSLVFEAAQRMGHIPNHIKPRWDCSANLCVYTQAPRALKKAAEQLLGVSPDKTIRDKMKGKNYADLDKTEQDALTRYARHDAVYCLQLWEKLHNQWPTQERAIAQHTMTSGQRGVYIDTEKLVAGREVLVERKREAEKLIPWAEEANTVASLKLLKEYCENEGIEVPVSTNQNDAECIRWEDKYGGRYPVVGALRDWRKSNRIIRLFETIQTRLRADNTLPFNLKYFGAAATGRWSGDAGLNMQNLPRGEVFGVDTRSLFVPRPGKKFVVCDLAQIEPRCLAWIVGDDELLDLVRAGKDIYTAHAMTSMRAKRVTKDIRQRAKIRVLGLGYGCGAERFRDLAANWGYHMSKLEASNAVNEYRFTNRKIKNFWEECSRDMRRDMNKNFIVTLPNDRTIKYFNVHEEHRQMKASTTMGDPPRYWYGGKICENIVQATARDVFTDCYYRILQAGYEVVWTVHDEIIVEVDTGDTTAGKHIEEIMSTAPDWLGDCPLAAESYETDLYKK